MIVQDFRDCFFVIESIYCVMENAFFFDIDIDSLDLEIPNLQEELAIMKAEIEEIGEANMYEMPVRVQRYTDPAKRKEYYQRNKEYCKQKSKEYRERTNYKPTVEQKLLYRRNAYLRRREKRRIALMEEKNEEKNEDI